MAEDPTADCVGSIYATVMEQPTEWGHVLDRLIERVNATGGGFFVWDCRDNAVPFSTSRDPDVIAGEGCRNARALAKPQTLHRDGLEGGRVYSDEELLRGEDLRDITPPAALSRLGTRFHILVGIVEGQARRWDGIVFFRPRSQAGFAPAERAFLQSILPHLQRALQMRRCCRQLHATIAALTAVMEQTPLASLLVTRSLSVVAINRAARQLMATRRELAVENGRLVASRPGVTRQLQGLVESSAVAARDGQGASMLLPIAGSDGQAPLELTVQSIASDAGDTDGSPAAVLYLVDPDMPAEAPAQSLSTLYGFTPTEARLAVLLARGTTLAGAAANLKISLNTVRTHLKSVFVKTGTRRQAELVARLSHGTAALFLHEQQRALGCQVGNVRKPLHRFPVCPAVRH